MSPVIIMAAGVLCVFVALFLVLAALSAGSKETAGVNRSLEVIEAYTSAPRDLKGDLDASFVDRVLIPLLAKAQGLGQRLTPEDANQRIHEKLERAGNPPGWTVDRVIAGKVVGFVALLVVSLILCLMFGLGILTTLLVVMSASVVGYSAPNLYLYQKAYDRSEEMQKELADAIDLLTISVESGLGFDAAVAQVAKNTDGPLAEEFSRLLQEMQIGRGRTDALRSMSERTTLPDVRSFAGAMVQADAFGIPIGQVLRVQSSEIRIKRRQRAEEKAQQVPVKILVPLIFFILPCLFIAVLGPAALTIMDSFGGGIG